MPLLFMRVRELFVCHPQDFQNLMAERFDVIHSDPLFIPIPGQPDLRRIGVFGITADVPSCGAAVKRPGLWIVIHGPISDDMNLNRDCGDVVAGAVVLGATVKQYDNDAAGETDG